MRQTARVRCKAMLRATTLSERSRQDGQPNVPADDRDGPGWLATARRTGMGGERSQSAAPGSPTRGASCRAAEHAPSERRRFAGRADLPGRYPRRPPSVAARQPTDAPETPALAHNDPASVVRRADGATSAASRCSAAGQEGSIGSYSVDFAFASRIRDRRLFHASFIRLLRTYSAKTTTPSATRKSRSRTRAPGCDRPPNSVVRPTGPSVLGRPKRPSGLPRINRRPPQRSAQAPAD